MKPDDANTALDLWGVASGLLAAGVWAFASILYVKVPISAAAIATWKNILATGCLLLAVIVTSLVSGTDVFTASVEQWGFLFLSGVIGLGLADIAYFRSIQILGARRGVTLALLTPVLTAVLANRSLKESLSITQWLAIVTTLAGLMIVLRERSADDASEANPGSTKWGVACALIAVGLTAVGAVFMKHGVEELGSVEATFIRLLSASSVGIVISACSGHRQEYRKLHQDPQALRNLTAAALIGTVMGVWLMLSCFKLTPTGIASTLTSTTPLFAIAVGRIWYKQKITWPGAIGAMVALAGVVWLLSH